MLAAAVSFYDVVLWVHITAVVIAFGPTFAYPMFLAVAQRSDPRALPVVGKAVVAWDRIGSLLLVVILLAGFFLLSDGGWEFSDFFISWGFLAVIVIGGMSGGYFQPKMRQLVEVAERDIAASGPGEVKLSAEYEALNGQIARAGIAVGVVIVLTIYVMTAKPFV